MTATQSIVLGVVSGLISGFMIYFLSSLFRRALLPWYREATYKGLNLSGTWVIESDDYDRRDITLEISQKADNITGISTHVLKAEQDERSSERVRSYLIEGKLHDRFLTITGRPVESSRVGAMTFLMEVIGDGTIMKGSGAGYSSSLMKIDSRHFVARRVKETQKAE